jgi:hypothetical protein
VERTRQHAIDFNSKGDCSGDDADDVDDVSNRSVNDKDDGGGV